MPKKTKSRSSEAAEQEAPEWASLLVPESVFEQAMPDAMRPYPSAPATPMVTVHSLDEPPSYPPRRYHLATITAKGQLPFRSGWVALGKPDRVVLLLPTAPGSLAVVSENSPAVGYWDFKQARAVNIVGDGAKAVMLHLGAAALRLLGLGGGEQVLMTLVGRHFVLANPGGLEDFSMWADQDALVAQPEQTWF